MIKLFVTDTDGTLTDGSIYVSNKVGETFTKYSKIDGYGFELLKKNGIKSLILSSEEENNSHLNRAKKLNVDFVGGLTGNKKFVYLKKYLWYYGFYWENVAYIGDDYNDLDCLYNSYLSFCPKDSILSNMVDDFSICPFFVTEHKGGEGTVREAIEKVIDYNNKENKNA